MNRIITAITVLVAIGVFGGCGRESAKTDRKLPPVPAEFQKQFDLATSPDMTTRQTAAAELCIAMLKSNGVWRKPHDILDWKTPANEKDFIGEVLAVAKSDQPSEFAIPNACARCMAMFATGTWAIPPLKDANALELNAAGLARHSSDPLVRAILLIGLTSSRNEVARDAVVAATADEQLGVRKTVCYLVERCTGQCFGPCGVIHIGSPEEDVGVAIQRILKAYSVDKTFGAIMELQPSQEMEFKAAYDGSVQKYVLRLPQGFDAAKPHDLMIGLHGHGSERHQYATDPRGECKGARDVAARHEMIFISPDYREPASWMGIAAEADMVQLIGDLKKRYKVGKDELVPSASVLRLAAAVRKHNKRVLVIDRPEGGHQTSYEDTVAAIEFVISGQH